MPRAKAEQRDMLDGVAPRRCDPVLQDAFDAWNEYAKTVANWSAVTVFNNKQRCTRLREALETSGGLVGWRKMLAEAAKSDVLTGNAAWTKGSNWFNFDWLIKPANLVKVCEGNYKNAEAAPMSFAEQMRGVGTKTRYAQPVAEPFKHDIESPADRMAFTIERYRAAGKWADANRVEETLAALQKRPPVLVPAPDVAGLGMAPKQPVERAQPRRAPRAAPNGSAAPGPRQAPHVTDLPGWVDEAIPDSAYGDA